MRLALPLLRSMTLLALPLSFALAWPAVAAAPPAQPKTGPGGADYEVKEVVKKAYGEGSAQAFVFRPAGVAPQPRPVIVFMHLPGAVSPKYYGGWINHLVRKGNIVIYPRFEEDAGKTRFSLMSGEAIKGIKAALAGLEADAEAKPDLNKLAIVGHSGGAIISANVAAAAAANDLPKPRLVFGVMPMRSVTDKRKGVALDDLTGLDPQTVLITLVGDKDALAAEMGGREVIRAAKGLAAERRLLVKVGSDSRGQPPLSAGHFVPMALDEAYDFAAIAGAFGQPKSTAAVAAPSKDKAEREAARQAATETWWTGYEENRLRVNYEQLTGADAMDWLAIWRPFDIARDIVFAGGDAKAVARDTRLYDMGLWSDGLPVRRLNAESPRPDKEQAQQPKPQPEAAPKQGRPKRQL